MEKFVFNSLTSLHPLTHQTPNGVLDQVQFLPACCVMGLITFLSSHCLIKLSLYSSDYKKYNIHIDHFSICNFSHALHAS